jgi:hypothetical protein
MSQLHKMMAITFLYLSSVLVAGCSMVRFSASISEPDGVHIPFLKNSANECYYLDEFMPIPDRLVTGKTGKLGLRYYSYNTANYKDWDPRQKVILSFYSQDSRCWSLFEEYLLSD